METNIRKIASKNLEIMNTDKNFRERIASQSHEITEKSLKIIEKAVKMYENLANDEIENDIDDLIECLSCSENLFHNFVVKYNTDYTPEKPVINDSTFIETLELIKNKKCIKNLQNNGNQCFQYSVTLSLYHKQITEINLFRVSKIKPFIDNINLENINFSSKNQDYKTFAMNIKSIALNVLHIHSNEKIGQYYKSDFNKTRKNQLILLMIADNEKQHYICTVLNKHVDNFLFTLVLI